MPWQACNRVVWGTTPSWSKVFWLNKLGSQAFFNTINNAEVASYGEQSDLLELLLHLSQGDTHQGLVRSQKSEQLMQRESRTSGELLLPVSRRPSHREMTSQRNNEAPSRISNRTSPWWFTWQTVALVLYSWIPTYTMPWRHHSLRFHRPSASRETRPTIWTTNYQRSFTSWVHVRNCKQRSETWPPRIYDVLEG